MKRGRNPPSVEKQKSPRVSAEAFVFDHRVEEIFVLRRPGSDLLSQVLRLSTISAGEINGRVRDGIGYRLPANTTRPAKDENIQPSRRQATRMRAMTPAKLVKQTGISLCVCLRARIRRYPLKI